MKPVQVLLLAVTSVLATTVTCQTLNQFPESVFAEKNDNITLTCQFSNIGQTTNARFTWLHEGSLVAFGGAVTVVDNDRIQRYTILSTSSMEKLSIQKVIGSDGGLWSCDATIGQDTFETETHLIIKVPPSLVNRTQQEKWTPELGSSLDLYCNASGNPKPTVIWTKETGVENIILPDGRMTEYFIGNALKFVNVSAMHRGKYTCHASNGLKDGAYAEYTVNVPFPPLVSVGASSVRARRNQVFEIGCIVSSFPKIESLSNVRWTKGGNDISNNQNGYEYSVIGGSDDVTSKSILALPEVDSSVTGSYTCEFTNNQGTASASIRVEAGPAIIPDTGASTSGVAYLSSMAYLNLMIMAAGIILHFFW